MIKYQKLSGLKQQECLLLHFWRLQVYEQIVVEGMLSDGSGEAPSLPPLSPALPAVPGVPWIVAASPRPLSS